MIISNRDEQYIMIIVYEEYVSLFNVYMSYQRVLKFIKQLEGTRKIV